jgi:hypothetical protein
MADMLVVRGSHITCHITRHARGLGNDIFLEEETWCPTPPTRRVSQITAFRSVLMLVHGRFHNDQNNIFALERRRAPPQYLASPQITPVYLEGNWLFRTM